jgi:hypothetical protein
METIPEMTMTVLDPARVTGDAGQVTGDRRERADPEVPEKAPSDVHRAVQARCCR